MMVLTSLINLKLCQVQLTRCPLTCLNLYDLSRLLPSYNLLRLIAWQSIQDRRHALSEANPINHEACLPVL